MGNRTTAASARDVTAAEPVIRRVVAARTANPADIDDLVQDCLERMLVARERLAPEAVLPYAVVVARNLVTSHAKSAVRHAAVVPRALDAGEPERPGDALLTRETREAMSAALARLSDQERRDVLAYYGDAPARAQTAQSRGAVRVRMARTRAKLRLEYLLAFRHLELPSPRCQGVLLAISAGDTRRQRELDAGRHLLDCEVCAELSEPLDRRSIALTAIAVPVGLVVWAAGKARAHPVQATATAGGGAAAAAAVVVALSLSPHHSAPKPAPAPAPSAPAPAPTAPAPAPTAPAPAPSAPAPAPSAPAPAPTAPAPLPPTVISHLSIAGHAVPDAEVGRSLRSLAGRAVTASGATVVEAVTRNGFWIGSSRARLWVELVGPLRPLLVRAGDRVWFTGVVVGSSPSRSAQVAATGANAALLARQGAYVEVSTTKISVRRSER